MDPFLTSLEQRIVRIEEKVDKLISFRGWVLGATATLSTIISGAVAWITR